MGQLIYQSHATSTLLEADKRRIEEEYVYLDIITQRNGNGCQKKSTLQEIILYRNFIESWLTMI